jgi:hypothetical protein
MTTLALFFLCCSFFPSVQNSTTSFQAQGHVFCSNSFTYCTQIEDIQQRPLYNEELQEYFSTVTFLTPAPGYDNYTSFGRGVAVTHDTLVISAVDEEKEAAALFFYHRESVHDTKWVLDEASTFVVEEVNLGTYLKVRVIHILIPSM